jgi:hypothetical protein
VNRVSRSTTQAALLAVILLLGAACAPAAGPLGTPASPAVSPLASNEPIPSDIPASATPSTLPSASPGPVSSPSASPSASPDGPAATASPTPAPTASPSPAGTTVVRAYFILGSLTGNPGLVPVLREVPETRAVAAAAMRQLLRGPDGIELEGRPAMYTTIPDGTRLLDLTIEDRVATVVLSEAFDTDRAEFEFAPALAQVVYTLTQFPTVREVRIQVGEGGPTIDAGRRSDYQEIGILPAIFVDRPAWGASAGNPARINGIANVFEATFRVQLLDARGNLLAEETVTASCGTGCWGSFRTDLGYDVGRAQYGTLRVFAPSAKDGSPDDVTEYRVWLTP